MICLDCAERKLNRPDDEDEDEDENEDKEDENEDEIEDDEDEKEDEDEEDEDQGEDEDEDEADEDEDMYVDIEDGSFTRKPHFLYGKKARMSSDEQRAHFVQTVKDYLNSIEEAVEKVKKLSLAKRLFMFIGENIDYLRAHQKFALTVKDKLFELYEQAGNASLDCTWIPEVYKQLFGVKMQFNTKSSRVRPPDPSPQQAKRQRGIC